MVALAALGLGVSSMLPDMNAPTSVGFEFLDQLPALYQSALEPQFDPASGAFLPGSAGLQSFTYQGVTSTFYMNGVALAGQNGVPRGVVNNYWKTYQPRFGFSYDLMGRGQTVLRGGFGAFFERIQGNDIFDSAGHSPFISAPSANDVEFTNTSFNWHSGGAASTPLFPQNLDQSLSTYYPDPAVAQFSLGIQHELAPSLILVTQYVGNLEWHRQVNEHINNYPLSTPMAIRQLASTG